MATPFSGSLRTKVSAAGRFLLFLVLLSTSFAQSPGSGSPKEEAGRYLYSNNGHPAGSESFTIRPDKGETLYAGKSELVNGRYRVDQQVELRLDPQGRPLKLVDDARVNGQRTQIQVLFEEKGTQWKTQVEDRTEETSVFWPRDQLLIADNVIHHLTALARRYDTSKPGPQLYARTLSGAQPSLELLGRDQFTREAAKEIFFRFRLLTGGQRLYLWTNSDNLVIKAIQPESHFHVVLEGWEYFAERLQPGRDARAN